VPPPQTTHTFGGPPHPPNAHRVPSPQPTHPAGTPSRVSPGRCQHPPAPPGGCGVGGTALLCLGRARVRASVLLPPRDPPPRVPRSLGPTWGGDRMDGPLPTLRPGAQQPERGALPHASQGHPQTPSGGTQGGLSPPPTHAPSHPKRAAPAQPPLPVPREPGDPTSALGGGGRTRWDPISPRESAPRRSAGDGGGPSAPAGVPRVPGVPSRVARNRWPAPRRC